MLDQFPILRHAPYLNHAAVGPWPECTARAVRDFADENMLYGSSKYLEWIRREQELRSRLARMLNAPSPDDIALLKNTTEGISLVAWGLDWRQSDNVVLPRGEFSSNRLPWLAQGVEVREVDIQGAENAERALIAAMDGNTRLLSVSSVQWNDGFRLDLDRLGAACRQAGVLFFVDAIQQLGALPIDVDSSKIDFLAADGHKWLLAPEGVAVFYSRETARKQLKLTQQGWHMFERPWQFEREDWTPAASAKRFEAGSPNSLGQAALHASTGLLLDFGLENVAERVLANTRFLLDNLAAIPGVKIVSRTEAERRSGIVSFKHRTQAAEDIYRALQHRGISCAVRDASIRLSPHFYQGEKELLTFLDSLDHIV